MAFLLRLQRTRLCGAGVRFLRTTHKKTARPVEFFHDFKRLGPEIRRFRLFLREHSEAAEGFSSLSSVEKKNALPNLFQLMYGELTEVKDGSIFPEPKTALCDLLEHYLGENPAPLQANRESDTVQIGNFHPLTANENMKVVLKMCIENFPANTIFYLAEKSCLDPHADIPSKVFDQGCHDWFRFMQLFEAQFKFESPAHVRVWAIDTFGKENGMRIVEDLAFSAAKAWATKIQREMVEAKLGGTPDLRELSLEELGQRVDEVRTREIEEETTEEEEEEEEG